jgi:hypothetical protein
MDDTFTSISWRTCVTGKGNPIKTLFQSALRLCIEPQILVFRDNSDISYCIGSNSNMDEKKVHIDHEIHFVQLVEEFMKLHLEYSKIKFSHKCKFTDSDSYIGDLFAEYHSIHAKLRVLCESCNLTRPKYKSTCT